MAYDNMNCLGMVSIPFEDFANYLDSDEFYRYRCAWKEPHPPSLLDIIHVWLMEGDATLACGTYENFLIAVISIIEQWYTEELTSACGSPLWPGVEARHSDREPITVFSRVDHGGSGDFAVFHTVLNRTLYELTKATQEAHQRNRLIELLQHDNM